MLARYFDNATGYYSLNGLFNSVLYQKCYDHDICTITDIELFTSADLTTCEQSELDVIYRCKHILAADIDTNVDITPRLCKFLQLLECLYVNVNNDITAERITKFAKLNIDLPGLKSLLVTISSECNQYDCCMNIVNKFISKHNALELVYIDTNLTTDQLLSIVGSCKYLGITQMWNDPTDLFDAKLTYALSVGNIKILILSIRHANSANISAIVSNKNLRYVNIIYNTDSTDVLDALFANTNITHIYISGFANACEYVVRHVDKLYARRIEIDMLSSRWCPLDEGFGERMLANRHLQRCKFLSDQWSQCTYARTVQSRNQAISFENVHKVIIDVLVGFLPVVATYDIEIYPVAVICTYLNAHYHLVNFNRIYKLVYDLIMSYRKIKKLIQVS